MRHVNSVWRSAWLGWLAGALALLASPSFAATVWTDWTSFTLGADGGGSAAGAGGVVTYSGELDGVTVNGSATLWAPLSTYIGGTITSSPNTAGDELRINGSYTGVNTVTWAAPVTNPVFAFWSLGHASSTAAFIFDATPTFQVGGPSAAFLGVPIVVSGNTVSGNEGNGVVQFNGTFSSISWTSVPEGGGRDGNYAFTVGSNGPLPPVGGGGGTPSVPEPSSLALIGLGLAGLGASRRKKGEGK